VPAAASPDVRPDLARRHVTLQGGKNFRDLGGYEAADGRRVRWGKLYRAGGLAKLTEDDFARLADLGIAVVCDFRTPEERLEEPTPWPGRTPPRLSAVDYHIDSVLKTGTHPGMTPQDMQALMHQTYVAIAYGLADNYRAMFAELLAGSTPLVFHCAAGKDRTGLAAALILEVLGVSRETILEDYALTEKLAEQERAGRPPAAARAPIAYSKAYAHIAKLKPEVRAMMMRSDPDYLNKGLQAIAAKDGSMGAYLKERLGVGPAEIARLRETLLEA
jgi:protein-tyrosine phosphatase